MVRIQAVLLVAVFGTFGLFGQDKTPRKLISSMEGKDLYMAYCASCHGINGRGDGPASPAMKSPMADLATITKRNNGKFPREEMEHMILGGKGARVAHGSEQMPVWGPVFRKVENDRDYGLLRVSRVVDYIMSMQKR